MVDFYNYFGFDFVLPKIPVETYIRETFILKPRYSAFYYFFSFLNIVNVIETMQVKGDIVAFSSLDYVNLKQQTDF